MPYLSDNLGALQACMPEQQRLRARTGAVDATATLLWVGAAGLLGYALLRDSSPKRRKETAYDYGA